MALSTDLFDFDLPEELIAAFPSEHRGEDRLMVVHRDDSPLVHSEFSRLGEFLVPGDLLVFNDVRVHKARIFGTKLTGGRVEILLLEEQEDGSWQCLANASRPLKDQSTLTFQDGITALVEGRMENGHYVLRFSTPLTDAVVETIGHMPLPPYILKKRGSADAVDDERYQTVYAREGRAVAAPTAGLHFTSGQLEALLASGIEEAYLTLNVGWGTFAPVKTEDAAQHVMHREQFSVPEATADAVNRAKAEGRRVIAVGTTVVRALESAADASGAVRAGEAGTEIFIKPGYDFAVIDGMITNFHTPRSTLLMMVSAFSGYERILHAYNEAVAARYRFFSYGDAMLLL